MMLRTVAALASPLVVALAMATFQDPTPVSDDPGPVVGAAAPTFQVNDHLGKVTAVGGKSERWTVLAFYPKAATPG